MGKGGGGSGSGSEDRIPGPRRLASGKRLRRIWRLATADPGTFGIFPAPLEPLVVYAQRGVENVEAQGLPWETTLTKARPERAPEKQGLFVAAVHGQTAVSWAELAVG